MATYKTNPSSLFEDLLLKSNWTSHIMYYCSLRGSWIIVDVDMLVFHNDAFNVFWAAEVFFFAAVLRATTGLNRMYPLAEWHHHIQVS